MSKDFFKDKLDAYRALKSSVSLKSKNKSIGLVILDDLSFLEFILPGLEVLNSDFVILSSEISTQSKNIYLTQSLGDIDLLGFDYLVTDNEIDKLLDYLKLGITPIIPSDNIYSGILNEFNPLNSSGNSYQYIDNNPWSIYSAIVRYLENFKMRYDNEALVKNVLKIK